MPTKLATATPPPSVQVPNVNDPIRLLDRKLVANFMHVHVRTLDALVSSGGYPQPDLRLGGSPRWSVLTHNRWVESQMRSDGG